MLHLDQAQISPSFSHKFFNIISPAEEEREISGNNAYFQDPLDTQTTKVITRSVMYDSMRAQHRCAAHCIRSAHIALVVAQHERGAVWMMSASAPSCWSPNMALSKEKTRSAAAELGVKAKTI